MFDTVRDVKDAERPRHDEWRSRDDAAQTQESPSRRPLPSLLTSREAAVLRSLTRTPQTVDEIASSAVVPQAVARSMAKRLVIRGLASAHGDGRYAVAGVSPQKKTGRSGDIHMIVGGCKVDLLVGDAEDRLMGVPASSVDIAITSSPYFHERDYWSRGQIGWEETPPAFASRLLDIFGQQARTLTPWALSFWNFDDYVDNSELAGIDVLVLGGLRDVGLARHRKVIWHKPNHVPNGTDTSLSHAFEDIHVLRRLGGKHYWDTLASREEAKHGGMKRMSDVWTIPVANHNHPGIKSHSAVFPLEVVARCLNLATSEHGYCPECRAPWRRVLERGASTWSTVDGSHTRSGKASKRRGKADYCGAVDANNRDVTKKMADMKHVGWEPTCLHAKEPTRATVLDMFMGSGTTGLVSVQRGFNFVGIDVNADSVAHAAQMIERHSGLSVKYVRQ